MPDASSHEALEQLERRHDDVIRELGELGDRIDLALAAFASRLILADGHDALEGA
ncbi:MAG TPA: hypothetical protein PJ982_00300 [Lacipirellulaceae bacterium]|nr:hypothetical protein [Lacipirellulaceae bacterium]